MKVITDSLMEEVKAFIDQKFSSACTVTEISFRFNINRRCLSERFQYTFNKTPQEYIQELKLEMCISLLRATRATYKAYYYAKALGLNSSSALCKFIKRQTGYTFSEYKVHILDTGSND